MESFQQIKNDNEEKYKRKIRYILDHGEWIFDFYNGKFELMYEGRCQLMLLPLQGNRMYLFADWIDHGIGIYFTPSYLEETLKKFALTIGENIDVHLKGRLPYT
jgi:hypothetical protein